MSIENACDNCFEETEGFWSEAPGAYCDRCKKFHCIKHWRKIHPEDGAIYFSNGEDIVR